MQPRHEVRDGEKKERKKQKNKKQKNEKKKKKTRLPNCFSPKAMTQAQTRAQKVCGVTWVLLTLHELREAQSHVSAKSTSNHKCLCDAELREGREDELRHPVRGIVALQDKCTKRRKWEAGLA